MEKLIKEILKINEEYTKAPAKQRVFNKVKNNVPAIPNYNMMADLLFLPTTSKGFKYLFVVVDLATDAFDIEPIKNKEADTILNAMKNMFKRNYIKKPYASVRTDNGTEFKGVFHKYLFENSILHKTALPFRHKQMANVERLNRELGRLFNGYMNTKELETKKLYTNWDDVIDIVRKELNKIRKIDDKDLNAVKYPVFSPTNEPKYKVGDVVYYKLDYPENALGHKQETANFRVGDFRYHMTPKKIIKVLYFSDEPYYRYILEGMKNVSYSDMELKPAKGETETKYVVKEIIGKKKIKGKTFYLVHWKGYLKKDATWELEKNLIDDGLEKEINDFNGKK